MNSLVNEEFFYPEISRQFPFELKIVENIGDLLLCVVHLPVALHTQLCILTQGIQETKIFWASE